MENVSTLQPGIEELLEQVGARPRGGRFDCPDCGSHRSVTINEAKQAFNCHHAGCDFHGGLGILRNRLGIEREWLPKAEYLRQREQREQAEDAATRLCLVVHDRRMELLRALDDLRAAEREIDAAGQNDEAADTLAVVYWTEGEIANELDGLENASGDELVRILAGNHAGGFWNGHIWVSDDDLPEEM